MQPSLSNRKKLLILIISCITICALVLGVVFGVVKNNDGGDPTTALTGPLNTDTWTSNSTYYDTAWSGSGTSTDPFLIEDAADLAGLAYNVNMRAYNYNGVYFTQTTNLDLKEHYWQGIGAVNNNYFAGHYDGGGFTISNMFTQNISPNGLFGRVGNASSSYIGYISNVGIIDSIINGSNYDGAIGAIVGYAYMLNISNCYNSAQVVGSSSSVGGIVGYANYVVMTNCYNTADVSGSSYVGGLIGQFNYSGTGSNTCEIEGCYNTGNISGHSHIGGLIGRDYATAPYYLTLQENYNAGDVSAQSGDAGGLIGQYYITAYGTLTLQDNYNAGNVTGGSGYVGGIIGQLYSSLSVSGRSTVTFTANIYNCMNFGDVSMTSTSNYYAGGIIGNLYSYVYSSGTGLLAAANATATVNIANVLNNGTITNNNGYTGDTGGIIGYQNFSVNEAERYSNSTANFNMSFAYNLGAIQSSARKGGLIGYKGQNILRGDLVYTLKKNVYGGACDANVGGINGKDEANAKFDETLSQSQLKTLEFYNTIGKWDPGNWFMFGVTWQLDENINDGFPSLILSDANETLDSWTSDSSYYDTAWAGTGAEGDPYLIENAADLAGLSYSVNAGTNYSGLYFKQTANIDLAEHMWSAIGTSSRNFEGNFDGGNFEITNLNINASGSYQGLFGRIYSATISNVNIVDANIVSGNTVGGIVGYAFNRSTIDNCSTSGNILSSASNNNGYAGGVVGNADSGCIIKNCTNSADIIAKESCVGGIVGGLSISSSSNSIIQNCYNFGNVIGSQFVGGVVGRAGAQSNPYRETISKSSVLNCGNSGVVYGDLYVGGIAGFGGIRGCYNTGEVVGVGESTGGIAGVGRVQDCYNTANISGVSNVGGIAGASFLTATSFNLGNVEGEDAVGGVAGSIVIWGGEGSLSAKIYNSLNLGGVTGLSNIGPIAGQANANSIFNTYYGGNCIQIEEWQNSGFGLYSPTIENDAKDITFYQNIDNWDVKYLWDFENIWQIDSELNDGYPSFKEDMQIDADSIQIIAKSLQLSFQETEGWVGPRLSQENGYDYSGMFTINGELYESVRSYKSGETLGSLPIVAASDNYNFIGWYAILGDGALEVTSETLVDDLEMPEIYAVFQNVDPWTNYRSSSLQMQGTDFLITSAEDLAFVAYEVSQGNSLYINGSYIQTQNIDLTGHYWVPIGTNEHPFAGNYDGNGYTISGINYFTGFDALVKMLSSGSSSNLPVESTEYNALFRNITGVSNESRSQIKNIGVTGESVQTFNPCSAIAGHAQYVDFQNCYNTVDFSGIMYAVCSGLVTYATDCSFTSCYNEGTIGAGDIADMYDYVEEAQASGNQTDLESIISSLNTYDMVTINVGSGLVVTLNNSTMIDCHNSGAVGAGNNCGGLVAFTNIERSLQNLTVVEGSVTRISNCYNEGTLGSAAGVGGLVFTAYNKTIIENCYNSGNMVGVLLGVAGGIAAQINGTEITNTYNSGNIIASLSAGGIIDGTSDKVADATNSIVNCFNAGKVDNLDLGSNIDSNDMFGGIVGDNSAIEDFTNNYYGGNCGQIGGVDGSDTAGATYLPTLSDDAKNEDWYKDGSLWNPDYPWNIGEDWFIVDGYPTFEPPTTWLDDPSYYDHVFEGMGEKDKPYLIQTNKELAGLSYLIQNYNETYVGKYFKLTADVDMSEYYWVPIGTSAASAFRGYFDGGNHVISGLKTFLGWDGTGLFGTALSTTDDTVLIQNVIISESKISGSNNTGGVVGIGQNISLQNCQVAGETSVKGGYVGGIAGYVMQSTVQNCFVNGSLQLSGDYLGGVVGYAQSSQIVNSYLSSNAIVTGTASGVFSKTDSGFVGGIVGGAQESEILQAYNYGTVNATWGVSIENLSGTPLSLPVVGGIIGFAKQQTLVYGCNNLGTVTCDIFAAIGGIAGQVDNSTISTCFNYGTLKGSDTQQIEGAIKVIGGIVATPINNAKIYDCTNYATIIEFMGYTGGIAGMSMPTIFMLMGGSEMEEFLLSAQQISIENCYNYGNIESLIAGGIIAMAIKCNISDCINAGVVGFYDEKHTASDTVGGIAAMVGGDCTLDGLYNIGDVIGENCAAGIVGMVQSLTGEVQTLNLNHCFNSGTIYTYEPFAAGLVGNASSFNLTITNSESIGDIHIILIDGGFYGRVNVSGIVGSISGSGSDSAGSLTVSNCAVKMEVYFECRGTTSIEENGAYVAGICFEIEVNSIDIDNCAINITGIHYSDEKASGIVVSDANVNPFFIYSPQDTLQVVNNCYALITNNTTNSQNNIVLDNGGMDGNFVYKDGMFDGMAVPVNLYHIDDYITSTGILNYLQQTFNVQPYVAA